MHTAHENSHFSRQGVIGVRELFSDVCPMDLRLADNKAPWSLIGFKGVRLRGLQVFHDAGIGIRSVIHSSGHIEAVPTDDYIVAVPVTSRSQVAQGGTLSHLEPGSFLLLSTAKPFTASVSSAGPQDRFLQLLAKVPGTMLRARLPQADESLNQTISLESGEGRVMKAMLELALAEGGSLSDNGSACFSTALVDAVVNATAARRPPAAAKRRYACSLARIREVAQEYVERNFSNPRLDISLVAEHCQVSARYLHAAFAEANIGLAAFIREQRLLRCRSDLTDHAQRNKPVIEIAMRWGFDDPAHFSRLYKTRFGRPPSMERQAQK